MAIPKFQEFYKTILNVISDGREHGSKEIIEQCAKTHGITEEERNLETEHSGQPILYNRVMWAITYLRQAGLLVNVNKGIYKISDDGKTALNTYEEINNEVLLNFPSFKEFKQRHKIVLDEKESDILNATPEERIQDAIDELQFNLIEQILDKLYAVEPHKFERLVCDLLERMGYGKPEYNKSRSSDGGIDGIVRGDKLGFDSIYIQAKRWNKDSIVGSQEIKQFSGAMHQFALTSQKGMFVTTTKFSKDARDYAEKNITQKIVLIDGEQLAKLLIDYDLGVSTEQVFKIKKLDTDFFEN